jgi:Epoxide hydrolase N terminus
MWRVADRLNRYEQFVTTIDGVDIHFLRVRSPVEGATPCIMTHGWPGSVMEFIKVIDPLVDPVSLGGKPSDALELVISSLPGHGWSGKPTVTGWSRPAAVPQQMDHRQVEKIAQAWIELMDRLGHERWVAQGGDWGALVSSAIGRLADPAKLIGIHFNWALADPAKLRELGGPSEEEQRYLARLQHSSEAEGGYAIEQGTKQTVGYGLTDSPVGQLAWIVEKFAIRPRSAASHNVVGSIGPQRGGQGLNGPVELWIESLTEWATDLGLDTFVFWPEDATSSRCTCSHQQRRHLLTPERAVFSEQARAGRGCLYLLLPRRRFGELKVQLRGPWTRVCAGSPQPPALRMSPEPGPGDELAVASRDAQSDVSSEPACWKIAQLSPARHGGAPDAQNGRPPAALQPMTAASAARRQCVGQPSASKTATGSR